MNKLDQDIPKGSTVLANGRKFVVSGGFGLLASTNGTKIFGRYEGDTEDSFIRGSEVDKII